jgi:hypothetical protein
MSVPLPPLVLARAVGELRARRAFRRSRCAVRRRSRHAGRGETVVALHRQLERLAAVVTRAAAAFDAGRDWEADGARSSAAWISARCRLPHPAARGRVRLGRALGAMPATEGAWLAGEIAECHAEALATCGGGWGQSPSTPTRSASWAGPADALRGLLAGAGLWAQAADPDGVERTPGPAGGPPPAPVPELRGDVVPRTACSTPSVARPCPGPWERSRTTCSRPTGPRPRRGRATTCASRTWPAPRPSAGPTPRAPPAVLRGHPPGGGGAGQAVLLGVL